MMQQFGRPICISRDNFESGDWSDALGVAEACMKQEVDDVKDGSISAAMMVLAAAKNALNV